LSALACGELIDVTAIDSPTPEFITGRPELSEADFAELAERWREQYRNGSHRVMVLPSDATWTPLRRQCCSYCRCEMTGIRCVNCGAPATGSAS
jgi:hypothetical protein